MSRWADWMSNPQYLAQVAHFLGGCLLLVTTALFFGFDSCGYALVIGICVAGLKEFVYDTADWGEGDSWADSAMDFGFYLLGGLVGLGLAYWAPHVR